MSWPARSPHYAAGEFAKFQQRVAATQRRQAAADARRKLRGDPVQKGIEQIIKTHPHIQLDRLSVQLAQIRLQYSGFLAYTLHNLIDRHVIQEIKMQMRLQGVHQKVIDGTRVARVYVPRRHWIRFVIQSSYKAASGFNVAVMMESGRKPYVVYPKYASVLHWKDKQTGEDVYAAKSRIPRYPGKWIVRDTVRRKRDIIQQELDELTESWVRTILGI